MFNLHNYIMVVAGVMPHDVCDQILSEYSYCDEWSPARVGGDGAINTQVRNVNAISISQPEVINRSPDVRRAIDQGIFAAASSALAQYNASFPHSVAERDSGYDLLRYETGQFYKEHVDSFLTHPRSLSCSFALNEDYEGGEFAFFNRRVQYRPRKGDALMFPSNFLYPHEVMPVTRGTRFSIITWFI